MPYQLQPRKRGKTFASFLTVGALSLAAVAGTTYANLTTTTSTEADSEYINSNVNPNFRFNYYHAEDSEPIEADITPQDAATSLVFTKKITNDSALPAHAILTIDNFDTTAIPAVLLDKTMVEIKRSDYSTSSSAVASYTLRELVNNGVFFDRVIAPDTNFTYRFEFKLPSVSANDYSEAYGTFEEKFASSVVLSQAINGVSPVSSHYSAAGNSLKKTAIYGGGYAYLIDKQNISTVVAQ